MKLYYLICSADDEIYVESGEVAAMPPFQVGQRIKVHYGDLKTKKTSQMRMRIGQIAWELRTPEYIGVESVEQMEAQLCATVLVEKM